MKLINSFKDLTKFELILWIMETAKSPSYLPMVFCFAMFFVNDMYGFFNWSRIKKQQKA